MKYADAVCELDDMETKFKEKCEEHSKAVFIIKELLEKIRDGKTDDISSMEKTVSVSLILIRTYSGSPFKLLSKTENFLTIFICNKKAI